jgi:hypothetical protein
LLPFKLLGRVADNSFVRSSVLITGLSLALSGVTLAGIGEWAAGRFDSSAVDPGSSTSAANLADYDGRAAAAFLPPLPVLPETTNYLPANTPGYTFHHDVPEVRLQFTVADEQGRLVQNLSPADVRILDDQSPVPRFTDFERDDNLPLRLGMVVDTSDSVKRVLPDEKTAALNFLDRVMRPQTDNAFVMAFGGNVRVWQTPTANRQQLIDAVQHLQQPGWGTRFFDALYSACTGQFSAQDDKQLVHRAIIVLSDGDDTQSFRGLADVIAIAQRSEIQIYGFARVGEPDRRPFLRRGVQSGFVGSVRPDRAGPASAVLCVIPSPSPARFPCAAGGSTDSAEAGNPRSPGILRVGAVGRYSLFALRLSLANGIRVVHEL